MAEYDSPGTVPAGWFEDPMGRHQYRYWDGTIWTDTVADNGQQAVDPLVPVKLDPVAALRRREAEVVAELAEVREEVVRATESPDDAAFGNMLIADFEARIHGGVSPTGSSPLTRHTQLEEELESIRRQLAEAGE